jgi:hypothetical protein
MSAWLTTTCAVVSMSSQLRLLPTGWREDVTLVLQAPCTELVFHLVEGESLSDFSGAVTPMNKASNPVTDDRFRASWSEQAGWTGRLGLEDLTAGAAEVRFTRTLTATAPWRLGAPVGTAWVEVDLPRGLNADTQGFHSDPQGLWARDLAADARAEAPHPARPAAPQAAWMSPRDLSPQAAAAWLSERVALIPRAFDGAVPLGGEQAVARGALDDRGWVITLAGLIGATDVVRCDGEQDDAPWAVVADGTAWLAPSIDPARCPTIAGETVSATASQTQPQVAQAGEASLDLTLVVPPMGAQRALDARKLMVRGSLTVAAPAEGPTTAVVTSPWPCQWDAPSAVTVHPAGGQTFLTLAAGASATCAWTEPVVELWGALPKVDGAAIHPTSLHLEGSLPPGGAGLALDGTTAWYLPGLDPDRPLLTDSERTASLIDDRWRHVAYPEPALPRAFQGNDRAWEAVAQLAPALWSRAVIVHDLRSSGDWRSLVRARASGRVSEPEAAAIVALYAGQLRLAARPVLVADDDAGQVVPLGWDYALVFVELGDEARLIDPGCQACEPFAIRPELVGRPMLGGGVVPESGVLPARPRSLTP